MHGLDWYDYGARNYEPVLSRFTTMDPLAEKYYSISPYAYCAGNPVMFVDPDGRAYTKYESEEGHELLNTNDGSKAVVVVKQAHEKGFEAAVRGTTNTDDVVWNQAIKTSLTGVSFTAKHEALLDVMNSDASRRAAIQFWQSGNDSDYMKFVAIETASQWTNPSLVVGGLATGVAGLKIPTKGRVFWSGGGNSNVEISARQFAKMNNMITLEMTQSGKNMIKITNGLPWNQLLPMRKQLSTEYARGAKGTVHVFHNSGGTGINSIWVTTEYLILKQNNINIIYHNIP